MQSTARRRVHMPRAIPNIDVLPGDALLSRDQMAALTGYSEQSFKKWAGEGRGPRITYVEGRPRTKVSDYRAWIAGGSPRHLTQAAKPVAPAVDLFG